MCAGVFSMHIRHVGFLCSEGGWVIESVCNDVFFWAAVGVVG